MDSASPLSSWNPMQHIMSGQEPRGKLDWAFESQAQPSGLGHVTLSLGSSAFYLESEVEVVPAACPWSCWLCSALGGKGHALPSPTQFSQPVAGRGGVGGPRPPGRSLRATPAWARFHTASAPHSSSSLGGGLLWFHPDLDPGTPAPGLAALPPPCVPRVQGWWQLPFFF